MAIRITGLAKLVSTLKTVCKVIAVFGPAIRQFVPEDKLTDYDNALAAITSACNVILAINFQDDDPGTNPEWGS